MRRILAGLLLSSFAAAGCVAKGIELAAHGKTDYQIVITDEAAVQVRIVADELAGFLKQVTGAEFSVVKASSAQGEKEIIVGRSKALEKLNVEIDWQSLGPEGFVIRTVGENLVIAGGPQRGTNNGVYTFLEEIIGCRWYTPKFTVIPNKPTLSVGPLKIQHVPPFESRNVYSGAGTDVDWAARQRFNTFLQNIPNHRQWLAFLNDPKLAGSYRYVGQPHHTLAHNGLLPYAEFDKHPEYFALVDGKRLRKGQPCLTNPDAISLIMKNVREWIKKAPDAQIISISQGEAADCQCPRCKAVIEKHGITGAYMRIVNKVATHIAKDYPDRLVDTLAYGRTRELPRNIQIPKNVVVRYAPIRACFYHAFDECNQNASEHVYEYLLEWARIVPRVWVWYYALSRDDLDPRPNLNCLSRNFKLMRDAGVKGFFIQTGEARMPKTGGLVDLQSYLFAKLIWDPDYNVQKGIEEFARDCYGAAAPQIMTYVRMVNDADTYTGMSARDHMPSSGQIKEDKLRQMDRLFDEAERAVADDPGALERVKLVRLTPQYLIMMYINKDDPIYEKAVRDFGPVARRAELKSVIHPKTTVPASVGAFLNERQRLGEMTVNKAALQKTTTVIPFSQQWQFKIDPKDEGVAKKWFRADLDDTSWATVRSDAGNGWEKQGFPKYLGYGWYRSELPQVPEKKRKFTYMYFDGVDEQAWIYLNGKQVFEHTVNSTGLKIERLWVTPFSLDVSKLLYYDRPNVLSVRVHNSVQMGGIWRPVSLILSDAPVDVLTQEFISTLSAADY